ncbi:MAG: hypothetical protein LUQ69_00005, partial [Methanoregulaceae archaeon]|nr:hypothetical protein [Methanoregulaceae archaeon]
MHVRYMYYELIAAVDTAKRKTRLLQQRIPTIPPLIRSRCRHRESRVEEPNPSGRRIALPRGGQEGCGISLKTFLCRITEIIAWLRRHSSVPA